MCIEMEVIQKNVQALSITSYNLAVTQRRVLNHRFDSYAKRRVAEKRDVLLQSVKFKDLNRFPGAINSDDGVLGCRFTFTEFETSEVLTGAGGQLMI